MTNVEHEEFTRLMKATFTPDETVVLEAIARITIAHLEKAGKVTLTNLTKAARPAHGGYPNG